METDTSFREILAVLRPSAADRQAFRASGDWRDLSAIDDLARWAASTPDDPAVVDVASGGSATVLTWLLF